MKGGSCRSDPLAYTAGDGAAGGPGCLHLPQRTNRHRIGQPFNVL